MATADHFRRPGNFSRIMHSEAVHDVLAGLCVLIILACGWAAMVMAR